MRYTIKSHPTKKLVKLLIRLQPYNANFVLVSAPVSRSGSHGSNVIARKASVSDPNGGQRLRPRTGAVAVPRNAVRGADIEIMSMLAITATTTTVNVFYF